VHELVHAVGTRALNPGVVTLLAAPLATTEFLAVDTETNGRGGEACELTEVGAVLVGGGELHDRFESLVGVREPLSRSIQRLTGITDQMLAEAPPAPAALDQLASALEGRVLVAHNAAFDRRVLRQAFERAGLEWPRPPVLCTVALTRRFAPLVGQRRLASVAAALGIDVEVTHRALADAETCARVFCALFPKLCANAATVEDALVQLRPRRPARARRPQATHGRTATGETIPPALRPDLAALRDEPGAYVFANATGQPLYVGKSVAVRTRARSHFAASTGSGWASQAAFVEHHPTNSELGALLVENRLIKRLLPPANVRLRHADRYVYLRCRLDIPFPILEVAPEPAAGHGVTVGPLRGRSAAVELMEQLNSIFGLRHCGRRLPRRQHPSAYGQMGRCLSPCLGDLDPNLYRRRLDEALGLFAERRGGARSLLAHIDRQMRAAAAEERFERAAWLRRRHTRLRTLLERLGGVLDATHARPRLVLAPHPSEVRFDAVWLVGGRVAHFTPVTTVDELERGTASALRGASGSAGWPYVPADEVDEVRIASTWLAGRDVPALDLDPAPDRAGLTTLLADAGIAVSRRAARRPRR
jgi:DNA polymerase III subunit epsilon